MITYQEMYLNSNSKEFIIEKRLELVRYAQEIGIKKTAKMFCCSKNTVKRWLRRYLINGKSALCDLSKKPVNSPNQISIDLQNNIKDIVLKAKEKGKYITSVNVYRELNSDLISYGTVNRYVKKYYHKRKREDLRSGGNVEFKNYLKPFQLIQVDIKYLTDIKQLKPFFNGRNLCKYQITARDVASGYPIVAYCDEKSLYYTTRFLEEVLYPFLKQIPYLDLKSISIQTDNGKEFTNKDTRTLKNSPKTSTFTIFIKDNFKRHKTIIPGHCTSQSEIESFHWTIERDCLAWKDITNNDTLIKYTTEFINNYINKKRFNCDYTPLSKIKSYYSLNNVKLPQPVVL